MAAGGNVNIQVGFTVDKSGLSQMQSLFQQIAFKAKEPGMNLDAGLQKAASTANTLDKILEKTFNTNLGTLNVTKFNQELTKSGMTLKSIKADLAGAGNQGATAYNRMAQAILGTNMQLKESNKLLDSMATTMTNTVKWGITSSIFNSITSAIQRAYSYSKQLDTSLNDIRIVTDKSADSMDKFAEKANEAAKSLGASTLDYTNASLIYYQQGLSDAEVAARAETTIKAANVTGQTGEEVSEQLTAVWNGYKVTAEETEAYVDKLAAVAATTAADLEELSVGMSKVAAAANAMGVDFDDLNAQIATIVSVTRQAPESVGTALKTIYARLGDLKVDGVDEFGVKLGEVSAQMQTMGIQILDQNGEMRDMSSVIAEVAEKWNTWTRAQQQAAAVAMAGKRQYNNLVALFENWDMYSNALETSTEALGTLQHQQDIYMESTAAKLKTLKATWQDLYGDLIDNDELNAGVEGLTNLVQVFDNFIESFGGGIKSISAFGVIIADIFNKQIINGINAAIQRQEVFKQNLSLAQANYDVKSQGASGLNENATPENLAIQANTKIQLDYAKQIYDARIGLNQEQYNTLIGYQKEIGSLEEQKVLIEESVKQTELVKINDEEINDILHKSQSELFDINTEYGAMEMAQESVVKNTEEQVKAISDILSIDNQKLIYEDDYLSIINQIREVAQELSIEQEDILETELKQIDSNKSLIDKKNSLYKILTNILTKEQGYLVSIKDSEKAVDRVVESRKKLLNINEQQNNIKQQANDLLELGNNAQIVAQNITTISSSLSTMAMAWSSVSSLIKTINDDSISFGDKLTQSVMTLGMTIPMVITSFNKLNDVLGFNAVIGSKVTQITEAQTLAEKARTLAEEASTLEIEKNTAWENYAKAAKDGRMDSEVLLEAAINASTAANIANTVSEEANTISEEANAAAKELEILASEGNIVAKIKEVYAILTHKSALDADTQAIILNQAALLGLIAIAGVAVATIALVNKSISEWHKREIAAAEDEIKKAKAVEEEANANEDLIKSFDKLFIQYNELKSTQESTASISEDLREQTLKLAEAYDIQGASLLALGDNYDILNKRIKDARDKELSDLQEQAERGSKAASKGIAHTLSEKTDSATVKGNRFKDTIYAEDPAAGARLLEATKNLGLSEKVNGNNPNEDYIYYNIAFKISNVEEVQKELDNINNLIEYYENRYSDDELAFMPEYDQLLQRQEAFAEKFEELSNQLTIKYQSQIEQLLKKEDLSKLTTSELYNKIRDIKDELTNVPENKLDEYIKNVIEDINELEGSSLKIDLAERINKETGESIESILKTLDTFNDSDLALIDLHLETALLDGDLQSWVEKNSPVLLQAQLASTNDKIGIALENYDEKKGFKEEDLTSLFSQPNVTTAIGMSANDFNSLDYGDQLQALTNAWIENTREIVKNKDTLKETLAEQVNDANTAINEYKQTNETAELSFEILIGKDEDLIEKQDELKEAFKKLADTGIEDTEEALESLDPSIKGLIKDFLETSGATLDVAKNLGEVFNKTDKLQSQLEGAESQYNKIVNTVENYKSELEALKKVETAHSAILDDIQSNYKSLISIIEDYNETKAWTIDNVQKLIEMDDTYVASLQFENGQLSLNEQAFQAMTLAKLDDLEATVDAEYQTKMLAIAEQDEKMAAMAAAAASIAAGSDMLTMGQNALSAAEGVKILADTLKEIGDPNSDYSALAEQTEKAWENRKKAIEDARKNVRKGGSSFKNAMGAGKKGGGGKDKKEKEGKNYEDEFDRYWELKKAIDAVDKSLQKLNKDQENLYGYQLIDSLKKENALLDQQAANYNKLLEAQQAEAAELREQLGTMGVMFDASGAIINYAAATAQALAAYNAAIQQYNAGLIDETTLGVAEKAYENFKKLLERYDTLYYNEIKETQEKLDDIHREQLANNLKAWEVEIQVKLDFKELKRGWNDFLAEINEDFKKVYKDLNVEMKRLQKDAKTYIGKDGSIGVTLKAIEDVKNEIDKMMAGGTSDMFESVSQAQEKLKELNEQLQKDAKALHDLWKEAWQAYLDGIEQVADKFDDIIDQFEKINDELEFQGELIQLLYGDEAYDLMDKLYKGQEKSLENQIGAIKDQADMWKQLWEESGATMDNQENWTEDQKKYYEQWLEAQGKLNDLTLDYIKLLKEDYSNTIKSILKELDTFLTGSSLKDIKEEWERITAYSDKYLDDVEQAYEAQKLANKIDQSIASTTSLKNQQKLQALREKEITYLREKEHLTQYDLDAAEARYQIALKEMALEDARNNKTAMKMVRNEQGNWSYQYMADEEDIGSKQQDLLDQYNQLYQLASDAYEENLNASIELEEEYSERLQEIAELRLTNEDEYNKKLAEIEAWYLEQRKLLAEENTLYRQDLQVSAAAIVMKVYETDHESIVGMTEEQKALLDELINGQVIPDYMELERLIKEEGNPEIQKSSETMMDAIRKDWSSSAQKLADMWNADDGKSVKAQLQKAYEAINKATEEYKKKVDWCADEVGRDFGPDGITGAIDKAANATDNLKDKTEDLVDSSTRYLDKLKSYVNSLEDAWKSVKDSIEDAIRAIEEYIQKRAEANSYDGANPGDVGGGRGGSTTPGSGDNSGGGRGGNNPDPGNGAGTGHNYFVEYWGYDDKGYKLNDNKRINDLTLNKAQEKLAELKRTRNNYGSFYGGYVGHYDTGGYTGEWGNDGRLAFLHQKELVLNKDDTANFLESINTLRDMTSLNGSINGAISKAIANMVIELGNVKSAGGGSILMNNTTENGGDIFNITAEFPNANDVNDIREALMSLPNLASQYVNRNLK